MTNPFLHDLFQAASKRYNKDSATMTHGEWMCLNTTLNKRPFSFERYPFQEQIANDMHPDLDCIKPSQVGLTEIQIRKALAILMRTPNTSLIYTMPNDKMFKRVSKARIQPLVDYDKAFKESSSRDKNSMGMMKIGSSWLYVTGAAEADATSINADFVFNDEIDLTSEDMLALFNSRLQGSDYRVNQRFSTPTYEGFGVDKGFAASDQHEYMLKCSGCNHWQVPLFNRTFVRADGIPDDLEDLIHLDVRMLDSGKLKLDTARVYCEKCGRTLNLADYDRREWVAKYPSRVHHRGYRVRPFSTHRLDPRYVITQLFKYKRKDNLKGFHNTVLGEPYTNKDAKLNKSQMELVMKGAEVPRVDQSGGYWVGIDMGLTCHIVIADAASLDKATVVRFLTCSVDELPGTVKRLDEEYRFKGGGIDRYPYTPTSNAIRDMTGGRIMPVEYHKGKEISPVKDALGLITHMQANRTLMLDYVAGGIRKANWVLYGYGHQETMIIDHFTDMVREEPEEGQAVWVKLNGNDHYFHAAAFMVAGMAYHGVAEALAEHVPMDAGFSSAFSGLNLGKHDQDFFGAHDLIGYSPDNVRDKIIIRHN